MYLDAVEAKIDTDFWTFFLEWRDASHEFTRGVTLLASVGLPRGFMDQAGYIQRSVSIEQAGQEPAGHFYVVQVRRTIQRTASPVLTILSGSFPGAPRPETVGERKPAKSAHMCGVGHQGRQAPCSLLTPRAHAVRFTCMLRDGAGGCG